MPNPSKKFNSVRAARLSLLLTLSLTVGIGTAIYAPLGLKQRRISWASQVTPSSSTSVSADFGQTADTSALDFSGNPGQTPRSGRWTAT